MCLFLGNSLPRKKKSEGVSNIVGRLTDITSNQMLYFSLLRVYLNGITHENHKIQILNIMRVCTTLKKVKSYDLFSTINTYAKSYRLSYTWKRSHIYRNATFFHRPSILWKWSSHNILYLLCFCKIYELFIKTEMKVGLVNFWETSCVFNLISRNMLEIWMFKRRTHRDIRIHSFWTLPGKQLSLSTIFIFYF